MAKPIPLVRARVAPSPQSVTGDQAEAKGSLAPTSADAVRVLEVVVECARRGVRGVMATVVARHGSAPGTPGQKLYAAIDRSGVTGVTCVGTVGGGAVEREVLAAMEEMLANGHAKHHLRTFALGAELGMCCGGRLEILLEPVEALVPLLVVGGGHVATACAPLLAKVGFTVTVVDAREIWGQEGRIEGVTCVVGDYDDVGRDMPRHGAVLVMTHDHALDQDVIEWALGKGFAYVGGVGSRAKAQRTRDRLEMKGFREEDRGRVRMPIGIDIGARLPDEIAVAITAEMVAWRRSIISQMSAK